MQHLDLTNTGLSEVFLFDMLPALRRAKSLLSFHVGANPGVGNKKLVKFWHEKLRCAENEVAIAIKIKKEPNQYKRLLQDNRAAQLLPKSRLKALEYKSKQMEQ